ncbi:MULTISPECIES: tetratricopeptide repeat protein [unclassified Methylobacterium]|uniref:tetratricopeptide repeat protein n=1 Tax=unclassified Methylobacterium TaxID=2615210 RepID=UPI00031442CE|nr:tetratricopeptide repeat protein [Methylobacterium sp. 4-46]
MRDRLGYPFEDRGRLELKNIMRPVGVFALSASAIEGLGSVATAETQEGGSKPSKRPWKAIGAGASIITLLAAGGLLWRSYTAPTTIPAGQTIAAKLTGEAKEAPRLSIVVLPFTNLSSDPEQEFFADGITEDLTTDLSHLAGSFVIARNTAFTYKGKAVDVKQLGRDLGVRYVLEGSVRRIGDKIIINAQLISSETGSHLWADRLEGERSRLGELQAEFVARLARSLDVQLIQEESLRSLRERPNNPDVVDLTLGGWAALNRPRSKVNVAEAINQFEQALRLDDESLQAVVGMSRALAVRARAGWSDNPVSEANKIEEMIAPVLEKRPHNAMAYWSKGQALAFKKQFEQAIHELDAAVDSNANFADGHAFSGLLRIFAGRSSESIPYFEKAIRLSPRDPNLNIWLFDICHAHSHMGNWEQAIDWCHKANAIAPYYMSYIDLATSYGWLGRYDEAKAANEGLLRLMPGYTVKKWATADWSNNPKFVAEYTRMVEGLRRSGLQEE